MENLINIINRSSVAVDTVITTLTSLEKLHKLNRQIFINTCQNLPPYFRHMLFTYKPSLSYKIDSQELLRLLDIVSNVYRLEEKKAHQEKLAQLRRGEPYRHFTLRNPESMVIFTHFLDRMIYLMEQDKFAFLDIFPSCPIAFWDKIDDLRETSYKYGRDSNEYLICLEKCKRLSYGYSDLVVVLTEEDFMDDDIDDYPIDDEDDIEFMDNFI